MTPCVCKTSDLNVSVHLSVPFLFHASHKNFQILPGCGREFNRTQNYSIKYGITLRLELKSVVVGSLINGLDGFNGLCPQSKSPCSWDTATQMLFILMTPQA